MTPTLTDDLKQAIEELGGAPLYLVDTAKNRYILMHAEQFERFQSLFESGDDDPSSMYPLIDEVMKEVWDDPAMDVYDDFGAHRHRS